MHETSDFDVVVVGGGHAGAEAALAAARMGCRVACVVLDPAAIGRMSCNPAIGGIAKGQLVREIDALGGEMGLCTDATGIQFRMLNTRKGPAVRSPRAQCDRHAYNAAMARRVLAQPGVTVFADEAVDLLCAGTPAGGPRVAGVVLRGAGALAARTVVLTTGTFLGGRLFAGSWEESGGRMGERGAHALAAALRRLGLRLARLKTGTPPRLDRDTIDFARLQEQPGDPEPVPFSFRSPGLRVQQVVCHLTRTTSATHHWIAEHAHLSPMYQGRIQGVGPRYCPSVEDKVMRFAERDHHLVFLEPEGRDTREIYPNGLSTSLPPAVQERFLRTIPGLEQVAVLRHGYAVEYDHLCTDQLRADLQVGEIAGLFAAGQINGTSGYEEAAGQGLVAGINAALHARGEEPLLLDRASSYLGVMIDDLCRVNPREPYRMFTSRAEFRLELRSDNADRRLAPVARRLGLLDAAALGRVEAKEQRVRAALRYLDATRHEGATLKSRLRRPDVDAAAIAALAPGFAALGLSPDELAEVEAEVKYEGYIQRARMEAERLRRLEGKRIPRGFAYGGVPSLSAEAREKLALRRPLTLGEAMRVPGVTPADLNLVLAVLARGDAAAGGPA
ncbi:MAG: tRNA uridine-5-carboxymethylaminomethyl(34) synthesis enzyme MnmG [Planctomycetes bacterium]|nr:tRNA uridine-5-carboxymethylaminomethyl(34) synthesis enzyme MnmG [Planctomycetota bacterium]